ncbi:MULTISPECIES: PDGLE domain-containing protein [unclassified Nocardioides]|uniref:PDGLE domain-containing protein n=1 Tax=unclassified Nocardioides TaxID=2615069 RepID=UPI000057047E|nr:MULTISPECIES: PDGLE domain-containing protein [unclassified Nocardioides]ABL80842.1 putative membrane protein [Nocardioides sp. JS614]
MSKVPTKWVVLGMILVALLLAGVVSRFADSDPDGLNKVSQDHGFAHTEKGRDGLLGGYGSRTGVIGVLVVLGLAGGVAYAVRRRHSQDEQS